MIKSSQNIYLHITTKLGKHILEKYSYYKTYTLIKQQYVFFVYTT